MWSAIRVIGRDGYGLRARRLRLLLACTLVGAAGCRDEAESPVGPATLDLAPTAAALSFRQITVGGFPGNGDYHACGVTTDDRAFCWGRNAFGQLGIGGDFGGPDDCSGDPCSKRPVEVAGHLRWKHLSAGNRYTCGVTKANVAYCWGQNFEGQLGNPTAVIATAPVKVAGGHTFRRIRTGVAHTCAITTSDVAFCWGSNQFGQLGNGTTTSRSTPVRVLGTQHWRDVEGDYGHTCGVTLANKAYCWGWNFTGQLGDGTTTDRLQPRAVAGGVAFGQIDVGWVHTCAVSLPTNLAYCWGGNSAGELGNNTTTGHPAPAPVSGTRLFETVSAGFAYTCGVTLGGKGFCWGANGAGQLGTGTTFHRFGPVEVGLSLTWSTIATDAAATCGVTADHLAYCWGDNSGGELGDGTTTGHLLPTPVAGPR